MKSRMVVGLGESLETDGSPRRVIGLTSLELIASLLHSGRLFIAAAALSTQERWRRRRVTFRLWFQHSVLGLGAKHGGPSSLALLQPTLHTAARRIKKNKKHGSCYSPASSLPVTSYQHGIQILHSGLDRRCGIVSRNMLHILVLGSWTDFLTSLCFSSHH